MLMENLYAGRVSANAEEEWGRGLLESVIAERCKHWHSFTEEMGYVAQNQTLLI